MAKQTFKQRPTTSRREREKHLQAHEDAQHAERTYAARQAIKRARKVSREAEQFLREN